MKLLVIANLLFSISAFAASNEYQGSYEFPQRKNQNFEGMNRYAITYKITETPSGKVMEYTLPAELTGVEQKISMQAIAQKDGSEIWVGERAAGHCQTIEGSVSCLLEFQNLEFNDTQRQLAIQNSPMIHTDRLRTLRQQVGIFFESEPIGIVTYPDYEFAQNE
jgi:hypothetical protein